MPRRIYKFLFSLSLLLLVPVFVFAQSGLVNINTASLEELDGLPGVGPTIAQRIIDGRPYATVEEISKVQGIGEPGSSSYKKIKDLITVGEPDAVAEETEAAEEIQPSSTISTSSAGESTHYSSSSLSTKTEITIALSAGRGRLGSVGSPLEFRAVTDLPRVRSNSFKWNFGDGSEGYGEVVSHAYEYPGEYVVVLNWSSPERMAISRTDVRIVEPKIAIALATPEIIELKNNSNYEVNMFGRTLVSGKGAFVFPQDTIIKPGQSVFFSSKVTNLYPSDSSGVAMFVIGDTERGKIAAKIEEQKAERIAYLNDQLALLKERLARVRELSSIARTPGIEPVVEEESRKSEEEPVEVQTATAKDGWLALVKRFFLRVR